MKELVQVGGDSILFLKKVVNFISLSPVQRKMAVKHLTQRYSLLFDELQYLINNVLGKHMDMLIADMTLDDEERMQKKEDYAWELEQGTLGKVDRE